MEDELGKRSRRRWREEKGDQKILEVSDTGMVCLALKCRWDCITTGESNDSSIQADAISRASDSRSGLIVYS